MPPCLSSRYVKGARSLCGAIESRLQILAPLRLTGIDHGTVALCGREGNYDTLLEQVQRLRAVEYRRDGAISEGDLNPSGLYESPEDRSSWHVLWLNGDGEVEGCARYRPCSRRSLNPILSAYRSALASDPRWGSALRSAVSSEILASRLSGRPFFEVGGWAIRGDARFSRAAFLVVLATFALGRILGGGRGIGTATTRNNSSDILKRLGARPLTCAGVELPQYFEPRYGCTMEILAFDADVLNANYEPMLRVLMHHFAHVPVISRPSEPVSTAVAMRAVTANQQLAA